MDDSSLGQNDPYRKMQQAEKDSVRPGFLGRDESGKTPDDRAANAADSLGAAEKSAEGGFYKPEGGAESAKENEEQADGFYSGGGRKATVDKKKSRFGLRKAGPLMGIILAIFGAGGVMLGTQTFQPFSLVAQFTETFNSMQASADMRAKAFFRAQMKKRTVKSPYDIFGKDFSLSEKQQAKLKEQGIEYDAKHKVDGKEMKVLKYTDADGKEKIVTADNFKSVYESDNTFFQKYNAGSKTWRGAITGWFESRTIGFLQKNNLTRNMFEKYKEKVDSEGGAKADKRKIVQEIINDHVKGEGDLNLRAAGEVEEVEEDENGNKTTKRRITDVTEAPESSVSRGVSSEADVKAKLDDIGNFYGDAANAACGVINALGAINALVVANQALQIMQMTTAVFESVDKTKAGYGEESPIMVFADALNEHKKTTNIEIEDDGKTSVAVVRDRSAMESAGIGGLYGDGKVNPNDPSVASFNFASNSNKILGGIGASVGDYKKCSAVRLGAAAISAASSGVSLVMCAASLLDFGVSLPACAKLATDLVTKMTVSAAISLAISALIPTVANMLMRNLVTEFAGENVGNALTLGANMYLGSMHRSSGGSLMTIDKYKSFAVEKQRVNDEMARFERMELSPFDITSKNTFMGSIMTQMMSFSRASSVSDAIVAGGSVVNNALIGLTPSASAYRIVETLPDSIEDYMPVAPNLASIKAIGDSFAYQYVGSDAGMSDEDPDEILNKNKELGSFNEDSGDNPSINGSSKLAKWILSCSERQSPFGFPDQNIAGVLAGTGDVSTGNSSVDAAANGAIGAVPFVGDIIDIMQSGEQMANLGYITGESCVAGNDANGSASPSWGEGKYYAAYVQDQSIAESMGIIDKSAVTAFLEDYYEKNPLDNSYEGMLARYSGLTKENVIALLDIIDYENYIASYDPSDRMVFGAPLIKEEAKMDFESEDMMGGFAVLTNRIIYADVRNRSFAV